MNRRKFFAQVAVGTAVLFVPTYLAEATEKDTEWKPPSNFTSVEIYWTETATGPWWVVKVSFKDHNGKEHSQKAETDWYDNLPALFGEMLIVDAISLESAMIQDQNATEWLWARIKERYSEYNHTPEFIINGPYWRY